MSWLRIFKDGFFLKKNPAGGNYNEKFFDKVTPEGFRAAKKIIPLVLRLLTVRSVVDMGCGEGAWLKAFQENGSKDVLGFDSKSVKENRLLIDPEKFRAVDFNEPITIPASFDLGVCLEVVEHLSPEAGENLIKSLTSAAPAVLFSAAIPKQGGEHHINEQWAGYWDKIFGRFNFERLDPFRRQVWNDPEVSFWYRQNLFLYVSRNLIETNPVLAEERKSACRGDMVLIHKRTLSLYVPGSKPEDF